MKIKVIGCGNAFSNKQYNQSFVLEENGRRLLIDCGIQTPKALTDAGYKPTDINDIYVSHLHSDHVGGLEYFAFLRYDWMKRPRKYDENGCNYAPTLIANEQLLKDLWNKTLRGGLESMEGFVATLETFFIPKPIEPNKSFDWEGWTVDLIQQVHIMSGSVIMPSFGIMFTKSGHKSVYFVTDSQHCSPRQMEEYYRRADIIFQDCECSGVNFQFDEGTKVCKKFEISLKEQTVKEVIEWPSDDMKAVELLAQGIEPFEWECFKFGSGVHANYAQLAGYNSANSIKLPIDIRKKMYLSHYQDFVLQGLDMFGNPVDWENQAKIDCFAGFAKVGMEKEI